MARKSFKGGKDKRDGGAFVSVPLSVLNSRAYLNTSAHGRMLLFDLGGMIAVAGMALMALIITARHTAELYRQEPLP